MTVLESSPSALVMRVCLASGNASYTDKDCEMGQWTGEASPPLPCKPHAPELS